MLTSIGASEDLRQEIDLSRLCELIPPFSASLAPQEPLDQGVLGPGSCPT